MEWESHCMRKCGGGTVSMNCTFEKLEEAGNPSVIFRGIVGSRAYGTANAQSDTDTRGVFVVPSMEYVRLVPPPKQVSDAKNDHTYYSLLRFCELMAEANPTTMEMLYLPEDCVITATPAFETLVAHRDMFITRRAVESHLGYAVSQMKKAKGANKRVWNPWPEEPPTPEEYCMFVRDASQLPKPLGETGVDLRTCLATRLSKSVTEDMLHIYDYGSDTGGVFRGGAPVVSSIPNEDAGKRIGILIFNRHAYESAKRQHHEYWDWRRNRNEARWVQQERGQLDYDAKNMMHQTRLLFSGENIVKNGRPIVRFEGEQLETLLSIRRGEWEFDRIIAHAEAIQARIDEGKGRLPADCDKEKVSDLVAEVMRKAGDA